ncbi:MAG: NifU family protein [Erysipelotrichales bacterium]|nr:NifU family protein [Erysipelotrichales bacterium]
MEDIEKQIIAVLNKIRPFIQRDGGDIDFHHYEDGVVYVKMSGACIDCALQDTTIGDGVEIILQEEVPGVVKVEIVKE